MPGQFRPIFITLGWVGLGLTRLDYNALKMLVGIHIKSQIFILLEQGTHTLEEGTVQLNPLY
jgi:hypothetical protein